MAGGGGALLTSPAMLLLGFTPNTVVATQKAGGIGINLGAFSKFLKHKELIHWRLGLVLSGIAVIAAFIGTRLVFNYSEEAIENAIAVIVLLTVPVLFIKRDSGLTNIKTGRVSRGIGGSIYALILTIQAGIGGGIGTLNMFVLMGPFGLDALRANATKRLVGLVLTLSSMLFFISSGYVDWKLAGIVFCSTVVGGYFGATIAIEKGAAFVRTILVSVSIAMATILLTT